LTHQYTESQLALQRRFQTEPLAAALASSVVRSELSTRERGFIESRDMFFLATVDASGQPTCSYKGGDPGFVRVLDPATLLFPLYDGNGMYLSAGNVAETARVGLLFLDFETPHRLRVEGRAEILHQPDLLAHYPEAQMVARVVVKSVFVNCPRYVHQYQRKQLSKYVPRAGEATPVAQWKRIDVLQGALPAADRDAAAKEGTLTLKEYDAKLARGEA
jgi:predicted pyridoxine 5'-phosphate oxidase superfamily flavin-nucleotide-binding protein